MEKKDTYSTTLLIQRSRGRSKNFMLVAYVSPVNLMAKNKPRRVVGFDEDELLHNIKKVWASYYFPSNMYKISGMNFIANNEKNAIKEYWRICEKELVGKIPTVELISEHQPSYHND